MRSIWRDLAIILGVAVVLSLVCVAGLDVQLARWVGDPGRPEVRDFTNMLARYTFMLGFGSLAWLAVPPLRRGMPLVSRCAGVFVGTLMIANLGLITNLKIERDRPRPSEVTEFGGDYAYQPPFGDEACACKSFPSSAAGFGFLVATPFFVLRRRAPSVAVGFLVLGLLWGGYIGFGRMVANMHWLSDIVWSAAFVLLTAAVLARVRLSWTSD